MDSGHVPATGAKIVASASRGHLVIHDLVIKTAELIPLAKVRGTDDRSTRRLIADLIAVLYKVVSNAVLAMIKSLLTRHDVLRGERQITLHKG